MTDRRRILPSKALLTYAHDLVMAAMAVPLALYLRVGADIDAYGATLATGSVAFTLIAAVVFRLSGMYRGVWRYASVNDLVTIVRAVTLTVLVFVPVMFLLTRLEDFPRSLPILIWFVQLAQLGGPRFLYRRFKDGRMARRDGDDRRIPVLLMGCDDEAELFIRATRRPDAEYRAVAMISEHRGRVGRNIHGVEVLGAVDDFDAILATLSARGQRPQRLIITDHRLGGEVVRRLFELGDRHGLALARTPKLTDLKDGIEDKVIIRPIAVEDLLGRPQAVLDRAGMEALIRGRRVLVTGAGGSIGSELVRQISDAAPAELVLFESCEFNLYSIDLEIAARHPSLARRPVLGDVRDERRVKAVWDELKPDLVFHAAALKHVPMVEWNPDEGMLTNAVGSRIVADACVAAGVRLMVMISTDKAVNPTNVMGASKRIAEMYTQALDLSGAATRFVTVRFGNVLGSTGSVVPLFQKQLAEGGPLTVTHPDMTRYFMTVREAVELVLQASAFGLDHPAYRGKIFVLDMGEPVRIVDLARQMIRLAGLRPELDVDIVFTGLRPGEKLFEEIFHGAEPPSPTECKGVLVAAARSVDQAQMAQALAGLERDCRDHAREAVLATLRRLVPEYAEPEKPALV